MATATLDALNTVVHGPHNEADQRPDYDSMNPVPALVAELFRRARDARRDLLVQWKRNYRAMHNRDWKPGATPWDEEPRVNQIYPVVRSCVAWMTDQRPRLEVEAMAEPYSPYWDVYDKLTRDMNTCLRADFQTNMLDAEIKRVLWDVKQYGIGYFETKWEPWLADGMGDMVMRRKDPWTIYPDPHARAPGEESYWLEACQMTVQDADRIWPGAAKLIQGGGVLIDMEESPHKLDSTVNARRPRAVLGAFSGDYWDGSPIPANPLTDNYGRNASSRLRLTDAPVITVVKAWIRGHGYEETDDEGVAKVWDDWRCVVVTGNVVIFDAAAEDVNSWGGPPYDRVVDDDIGEWYGPCLVEFLAPIQRLINWVLQSIVRNIYLMGNPVLKEHPNDGSRNRRFTNRPAQRISSLSAEWLQPPQVAPQMALWLVEFLKGEIESISGLSAMVRGFAPQGRNAQGVIDSVQDAAFVVVRSSLRELERALRSVTMKMSAGIAEFYTEDRKVSLIGEDGQRFHIAVNARHFYVDDIEAGERVPLRFSISGSAGSDLPSSKQARNAEAKHMYELGLIDVYEALKMMGHPNYALVAERVMGQQAQMAAAQAKPL